MDSILKTEVRDGVLWVHLPEVIDADSMPGDPELFEKLHAECAASGCSGIIFDARSSEIRVRTMDRLRGVYALAQAQHPGRPVAILAREEDLSPDRRIEKTAQQAGALLRMFTDEAEALAWVKSSNPTD